VNRQAINIWSHSRPGHRLGLLPVPAPVTQPETDELPQKLPIAARAYWRRNSTTSDADHDNAPPRLARARISTKTQRLIPMAKRKLRIMRETPQLGICEYCNTQFSSVTPLGARNRASIQDQFNAHKCERRQVAP
jgi:hypothetical protein